MAEVVLSAASLASLFSSIQPIYLLYGEDDHQKTDAIARLKELAIDSAFEDFDYERLDAQANTSEQILAAANLVPFASFKRLVVVSGAHVYRKREKQGDAERLAQGIPLLGTSTCLVLVASEVEETGNRKTILTAKLDAAIKAFGTMIRCKQLGEQALADWLVLAAHASGKSLELDAAQRIVQIDPDNRTALQNELEKVICFVGDGNRIGIEAVEAVCSYNAEDVMFKLVDAISQRNADRSLTLFHEILRFDSKPQSVAARFLTLLTRQLRLLWQASELARMKVEPGTLRNPPAAIAELLPADGSMLSMAWKAGELFRLSRGWNRERLVEGIDLALQCDIDNKGSGEGSENVITNLELLIVKLCAAK